MYALWRDVADFLDVWNDRENDIWTASDISLALSIPYQTSLTQFHDRRL